MHPLLQAIHPDTGEHRKLYISPKLVKLHMTQQNPLDPSPLRLMSLKG